MMALTVDRAGHQPSRAIKSVLSTNMEQLTANAEPRQRLVRIMQRREATLKAKIEDDLGDET